MADLYADTDNVIETLRHIKENGPDEGKLGVVHAGRARVVADTRDQLYERNLYESFEQLVDDEVCVIGWEKSDDSLAGWMFLELGFHEHVVENDLCFMPAGHDQIGADQATSPVDLGPRLREALEPLVDELGAFFTFKGVSAESIANPGHYTDFSYQYSIDGVEL